MPGTTNGYGNPALYRVCKVAVMYWSAVSAHLLHADWLGCAVLCAQADIIQMCANAKVYNHPNTKPHKEADVIFKYSLKYVSTNAVLYVAATRVS